jgi:hypothetical protein
MIGLPLASERQFSGALSRLTADRPVPHTMPQEVTLVGQTYTMLDLRLGLVRHTPEWQAEFNRRVIPILVPVVRREMARVLAERSAQAAAVAQRPASGE